MARPTTPLLSRDAIRDAALEVIDEEGLTGLTMRRLGDRLGVKAASLYGHVPTKQDVLDLVADRLIEQVDTGGFAIGWRTGMQRWARSYLAPLRAHPRAAPVIAAGAGTREGFLAMADAVHGGLLAHGWPPRIATQLAGATKYLVIGAASTPFGAGFAQDSAVYDERFPHLRQAHLLPQRAAEIDEASFELALQAMLTGFDALAREHGVDAGRAPGVSHDVQGEAITPPGGGRR